MRIVGGRFRGRQLATPRGRAIRPTSNRVREALFDILQHGTRANLSLTVPQNAIVLDVFAGTGAIGYEALSRGAAHVTFIEKDASACRMIEKNSRSLDVTVDMTLLRRNALRPADPPKGAKTADLLFLDPPYRSKTAAPTLQALHTRGWLSKMALSILEIASDEIYEPPPGFVSIDERRYGDTTLVFLRSEGFAEPT